MSVISVQNKSGVDYPITQLSLWQGNGSQQYQNDQDKIRQQIQEWMFNYYDFGIFQIQWYIDQAIIMVLGEDIVTDQEWLYDYINITKKIIDRLAVVYYNPAQRYFESEANLEEQKLTDYYNEVVTESINSRDKLAHRYAKLFNTSFTQVYFNQDTGRIDYRIEPCHKYVVEVDDENVYKITKVSYLKYFKNAKKQDELYNVVWTKDEHYKESQAGTKSPVGNNEGLINPFKDEDGNGVIPFAKLMLSKGEDIWGTGQVDLVNTNETVNFLKTYLLNDTTILGTSGTLLAINLGLADKATFDASGDLKKVRVGKRHPIVVENVKLDDQAPSLSYVSTNPEIAEIQGSIEYLIKSIAVIKGLNPNTIISEVKDTSDVQKRMDASEQLEVRRDDIEPCREFEQERFDITRAVNNYYAETDIGKEWELQKIPWDETLKVDFADIKPEMSQDEKRADQDWQLEKNLISIIDILRADNPDLDEEEAKERIEQNRIANNLTSKVSRFELATQPVEPVQPGVVNE